MCFSANVSFVASALLCSIGAISIVKAGAHKTRILAAIPFLFGLQQGAEGIVWLGLQSRSYAWLIKPASYIFLSFAFILWPLFAPGAIYFLESSRTRKNLILFCGLAGCLVAGGLGLNLFMYGVKTKIAASHIQYTLSLAPWMTMPCIILYLIATVGSFLFSSHVSLQFFGLILALSYAISYWVSAQTLVSTWCFFAAILSALILSIV